MNVISALQGTLVNTIAIIIGSILGVLLPNIPDTWKKTVMQSIGLAVVVIGADMAMGTSNAVVMIASVVFGSLAGEYLRIEDRLNQFGLKIESRLVTKNSAYGDGRLAKGFVFATIIYCVGSMAIVGSLDSGLHDNHDILYTKSLLDGFSAIIFASTMGIGIALSAPVVFIYQGSIALLASSLAELLTPAVIYEIRAVGGLMIMAIGMNLLEIIKLRVANMLPGLVIAAIIMIVFNNFYS